VISCTSVCTTRGRRPDSWRQLLLRRLKGALWMPFHDNILRSDFRNMLPWHWAIFRNMRMTQQANSSKRVSGNRRGKYIRSAERLRKALKPQSTRPRSQTTALEFAFASRNSTQPFPTEQFETDLWRMRHSQKIAILRDLRAVSCRHRPGRGVPGRPQTTGDDE
jgi:hypothetical protein